jgi:hypothetical protein
MMAHQDEIEEHLHGLFSEHAPEVIGNDYIEYPRLRIALPAF